MKNWTKLWYINVYMFPNNYTQQGSATHSRGHSISMADTAVKNGCKLLYRLKVKLK